MTSEAQVLAGLTVMMREELNAISKKRILITLFIVLLPVVFSLLAMCSLNATIITNNQLYTPFFSSSYSEPVPAGLRGPSGHVDYRLDADAHPALCIDTKFATFYDDAFSLSPDTGEILIHVVDVVSRKTLLFVFNLFTFLFRVRSYLLVHATSILGGETERLTRAAAGIVFFI